MQQHRPMGLALAAVVVASLVRGVAAPPVAAINQCDLGGYVCATLAITVTGDGAGRYRTFNDALHSSPNGIDCTHSFGVTNGVCFYKFTLYPIGDPPKTRTVYWDVVAYSGLNVTASGQTGVHLAGTFVLAANQTLTDSAYFGVVDGKDLVVARSGAGKVVSTNPGGIDCGTVCDWRYITGTTVKFLAIPDSGYVFTRWTGGGCSGAADCVLTITNDDVLTAYFDPIATQPPISTPAPTGTPKPVFTLKPGPSSTPNRTMAPTAAPASKAPSASPSHGPAGQPSQLTPPASPDPTDELPASSAAAGSAADPGSSSSALPDVAVVQPGRSEVPSANASGAARAEEGTPLGLLLVPSLVAVLVFFGGLVWQRRRRLR